MKYAPTLTELGRYPVPAEMARMVAFFETAIAAVYRVELVVGVEPSVV